LQGLGFTVDKVLDGNLDQIETAVIRLKNRLSVTRNSYGFFFYAGHGVQSNGVNYLIPVGASIPTENSLRDRAVSVQWALSELNDAGNDLNVVVLDACRDNPFGWARSGNRGLTVISNQPADSIIVYATAAGSTAADGTGRNGLFTEQFLKNLKTPGLEISEIFRLTMGDVARASNNRQRPAIYNQFPGLAYLGSRPVAAAPAQPTASTQLPVQPTSAQPPSQPVPAVTVPASTAIAEPGTTGTLKVYAFSPGRLHIAGTAGLREFNVPDEKFLSVDDLRPGSYKIIMIYKDGKTEEMTITIERDKIASVNFSYDTDWPNPVINPNAVWSQYINGLSTVRYRIAKEVIEGREVDVLNIESQLRGNGNLWANLNTTNWAISQKLREGSRLRFKVLGDGKPWNMDLICNNGSGGFHNYRTSISTKKDRVTEIDIPYSRFRAVNQAPRFDKTKISQLQIGKTGMASTSTFSIKIFDFEILP
jgi:hypothetical protein